MTTRSRTAARTLTASVLLLAAVLPAGPVAAAPTPGWTGTVNAVRALGGIAPVTAHAPWAAGTQAHADYLAGNGVLRHDQDPTEPGASTAGERAGRSANLGRGQGDVPAVVLDWLASPAHAWWLLNPAQDRMALGHARDTGGQDWWVLQVFERDGFVELGVPHTGGLLWPAEGAAVPTLRADLRGLGCAVEHGGAVAYWRSATAPTSATMLVDGEPVPTCMVEQQPGWHVIATEVATPAGAAVDVRLQGAGVVARRSFEVVASLEEAGVTARPVPRARPLGDTCPTSTEPPFSDVGGVFATTVACVGTRQLAAGFPDGTFRPADPLRVGQTLSFTARLLDAVGVARPVRTAAAGEGPFAADIAWLAGAGVAGPDLTSDTSAPMTRAGMAVLVADVARLAGAPDPTEHADWFGDDDGHPAAAAIAWVAGHGIVLGTGPGTFDPDAPLTRGQMATFLARTLALLES